MTFFNSFCDCVWLTNEPSPGSRDGEQVDLHRRTVQVTGWSAPAISVHPVVMLSISKVSGGGMGGEPVGGFRPLLVSVHLLGGLKAGTTFRTGDTQLVY